MDSDKIIRLITFTVPALITMVFAFTIAAMYVTSTPVPDALLDLVKMLIAYWIGLIAPSPLKLYASTGDK